MYLQLSRRAILRHWAGTPNQHRHTNYLYRRVRIGAEQRELSWSNGERFLAPGYGCVSHADWLHRYFFPTGPTFGARTTTVCGGSGKSARLRQRMGYIWFDFWTIRGPIKLPLSPVRYTTSTRAVRGSWCLQFHLASAFARGVQRNVDGSRGADDSRFSAALDILFLRFRGLWGGGGGVYFLTISGFAGGGSFCSVCFCFWYFVCLFVFGLGWGWFLRILSCAPPRSVSGLV